MDVARRRVELCNRRVDLPRATDDVDAVQRKVNRIVTCPNGRVRARVVSILVVQNFNRDVFGTFEQAIELIAADSTLVTIPVVCKNLKSSFFTC
jgi:hypothetical protein